LIIRTPQPFLPKYLLSFPKLKPKNGKTPHEFEFVDNLYKKINTVQQTLDDGSEIVREGACQIIRMLENSLLHSLGKQMNTWHRPKECIGAYTEETIRLFDKTNEKNKISFCHGKGEVKEEFDPKIMEDFNVLGISTDMDSKMFSAWSFLISEGYLINVEYDVPHRYVPLHILMLS